MNTIASLIAICNDIFSLIALVFINYNLYVMWTTAKNVDTLNELLIFNKLYKVIIFVLTMKLF